MRKGILYTLFLLLPTSIWASTDAVSPSAYTLTYVWGIPITNAMATGWVVSLLLILLVRLTVGTPKLIPSRGQLVVESLIESLQGIIEPIVGKRMLHSTLPFLISLFVFILINNLSALLPGVGTFGMYDSHGHLLYFFRPANADLNATLSLAIISMLAWSYYVLRYEGFRSFIHHTFGNKADKSEVNAIIYYLLFGVFFAVGLIECISIAFRLVSLSFRLYGNVFGGENLLSAMQGISQYCLPVPFYFLETLIGSIQAFVFMLLVAVYIGLVCNHGDEVQTH